MEENNKITIISVMVTLLIVGLVAFWYIYKSDTSTFTSGDIWCSTSERRCVKIIGLIDDFKLIVQAYQLTPLTEHDITPYIMTISPIVFRRKYARMPKYVTINFDE